MHHFLTGEMSNKSKTLMSFNEGPFGYLNPADRKRLGISNGDMIEVSSSVGTIECKARIDENIPRGRVGMHFHFEELLVNARASFHFPQVDNRTYIQRLPTISRVVLLSDPDETEKREDSLPLKVRDVMVREVITVDENSTIKEAVDIMNEFQIGSLIVLEKGKAKGIVTERDFLRRVIASGKDVMNVQVKEIMTTPLVVVEPRTDLEQAVRLMFKKKIKKLAVVDENKLVGIVTLTDIARVHPSMMKMLKQLATREVTPKSMQKVIHYYVV